MELSEVWQIPYETEVYMIIWLSILVIFSLKWEKEKVEFVLRQGE